MRVLISGGRGYVGARVARRLRAEGHEVAIVSRQDSKGDGPILRYDGAIEPVEAFFKSWRPDAVVHLAADLAKVAGTDTAPGLLEANVRLPVFLAQCAVEVGAALFLNISTYSTSLDGVEDFPQTLYAASKRAAEVLLDYYHQTLGLKVCTLVLYDVYGPRQPHARFLVALRDAVRAGERFHMTEGEQDICLLHVEDAAAAIVHALSSAVAFAHPVRNSFCVYGDDVVKVKDLPGLVAAAAGTPQPELAHDLPYRVNEIMRFSPRFPRLPGWTPKVSLAEGLADIL